MRPRRRFGIAIGALLFTLAPAAPGSAQSDEPETEAPSGDADEIVERVAAAAARSVVVVRCGGARIGTAFAFGATDRLATARHVADCPRAVSVETLDGVRAPARVAALGDEHDVAVLVLEESLDLEPIGARDTPARVGLHVYAIGWPAEEEDEDGGEGRIGLTVTRGVVGQVTDDLVYSDVTPVPGSSGGPLVDSHGRLAGVIFGMPEGSALAAAVPAAALEGVAAEVEEDGGDARLPVRAAFGVYGGLMFDDEDALGGVGLQLSLELWDQLVIRADFGSYFNNRAEWSPLPAERTREMVVGSLSVGYRFRFELGDGIALTLTPELGFSLTYDRITERTLRVGFANPACDPSTETCSLVSEEMESVTERWRPRPVLGLRVGFLDILELGYQLHLDVENPEDSTHQINLGFRF
jgi:S1-C subfamily serine protease